MTEAKVMTLDEVRAQIAAREQELSREMAEVPEIPMEKLPLVVARDEALERVCDALGYLERSLAEVRAAQAGVERERDEARQETLRAKAAAVASERTIKDREAELEHAREEAAGQQRKKQQAVEQAQALRSELTSLRAAQREVARQMGAALDRAEAAADGSAEEVTAAP
jgi:chromosome segregation ATPase